MVPYPFEFFSWNKNDSMIVIIALFRNGEVLPPPFVPEPVIGDWIELGVDTLLSGLLGFFLIVIDISSLE